MSSGLGVGGAEKQIRLLFRAIADRGVPVNVISMIDIDAEVRRLFEDTDDVTSLGIEHGRVRPLSTVPLVRRLRADKPRILVGFNTPGTIAARIGGALASIPVVVSSLRNEFVGGRVRRFLLRHTDSLGQVTCANSKAVAERLCQMGVLRPGRFRVIPNGVSEPRVLGHGAKQSLRATLGVPPDHFFWLAVGRLEPQKDYPRLLQAVAELRKHSSSPFVLYVAGDGAERSHLEELAASDGGVRFLGRRDDVQSLLQAADAFVLSSAWEGSPNAVAEALSCGTPVVVTDVGGVRELVTDGASGLIVPPRDSRGLSAGMRQMMAFSHEERRLMGHHGRRSVGRTHGVQQAISLWFDLFDELAPGWDVG